jgi:hypothetical protein
MLLASQRKAILKSAETSYATDPKKMLIKTTQQLQDREQCGQACLDLTRVTNDVPTITNLQGSYVNPPPSSSDTIATLTWNESNVFSRSIIVLDNSLADVTSTALTSLSPGYAVVTYQNTDPYGSYYVTINVNNAKASASAQITFSVSCFLGRVELQTRDGLLAAEKVGLGTDMLQPDGSYSKVVQVKKTTVTAQSANKDSRLFADDTEKLVVTSWHKIRFPDELVETKADEHPRLHEITQEYPFDVFHFQLEKFAHKILVSDTGIVSESFIPINPSE